MKNRPQLFFFIVVLIIMAVFPLSAQRKVTIKLASLVPENTPWGEALNRMAAEWSQATRGEVEMIIYHNGVAGDESAALRKLRGNQIQAALLTSAGLNSIAPEIMALSYPLLIRDNNELEEVLTRLRPELDRKIQEKNYVTLAWARAGWIKIFSKAPVWTPADLRRQKLGCNPGDLEMMQAFRAMGFQMIPLSINDILISLNSGMVEAVYISPIAAAAGQYFGVAKNMSSLNIAPFMGAIVMNQQAWQRIPPEHRPAIQAICKKVGAEVDGSVTGLEASAIETMVKYGLTVNTANARQQKEWADDLAKYESALAGPIFNKEMYQKIVNILTAYRTRQ